MGLLGIYWVTGALAVFGALIWLFGGCRHPNPHYIRPEVRRDEVTGEEVVVQPAQYCCYECGKTWLVTQRDPAWTATTTVQKFSGYDQKKAVRGAERMAREERQRRFLASRRTPVSEPVRSPIAFKPEAQQKRQRPTEIVDLSARKPA